MKTALARIKHDLQQLPAEELQEVSRLIRDLLHKQSSPQDTTPPTGYGWAKGLVIVPPDFDEPLEDFREYMS